ncbi:MAG: HEPN domain-containing protein [Candidatus Peribacteraceae bacterium]|nr:HEPN domain-containing protein [Candidatus Peribacteraceae bacterium]MDD5739426.1 HEPN domain-containing protein [Candidatus Peribacteraceae bacterium]
MSRDEMIQHWRKGAQDALEMAQLALTAQKYDHVLFNVHLAVEKALKSLYIREHGEDVPRTHDLAFIASLLSSAFSEDAVAFLRELSSFSVDARYHDPHWTGEYATQQHAREWLQKAVAFLSPLFL